MRELARRGWGVRHLRGLPPRVAWFYFRATRRALRAGDERALQAASGPESVRRLLAVAEGRHDVVEIGTAAGWTAIALGLADPDRRVTSFDPTSWPTRERYVRLVPAGVRRRVEFVDARGKDGAELFSGTADLVFVDGNHSRDATIAHMQAWRPRLAPGGVVVFHDYENDAWPGVAEAIRELGLTGETPGGALFVWRRPA
jgi:predicted O-methyltransferase YrrM